MSKYIKSSRVLLKEVIRPSLIRWGSSTTKQLAMRLGRNQTTIVQHMRRFEHVLYYKVNNTKPILWGLKHDSSTATN